MNKGYINAKNEYVKYVNFSQAVLWKDKQLSLPQSVVNKIIMNECKVLKFVDRNKQEVWTFQVQKIVNCMNLKTVGQEPQYYFPIDLREVPDKDSDIEKIKVSPETIPFDVRLKLLESYREIFKKKNV